MKDDVPESTVFYRWAANGILGQLPAIADAVAVPPRSLNFLGPRAHFYTSSGTGPGTTSMTGTPLMARTAEISRLMATILSASFLGQAQPAVAQSFECGAAELRSEKAVCSSDRLSGLDERMSRLYDKLMGATDTGRGRERLRQYQIRFLAARDACGRDTGCIKGAYLDQIEVLSARLRVAQIDRD